VTIWLNASFEMRFRLIGGLTVRFAVSGDHADQVNASFLHERLPHSKLDVLDAGHFTWEDSAADYAALVTSWWRAAANGSRK
jgi:pimeloyl-ACP methyl ester carboxylesterase